MLKWHSWYLVPALRAGATTLMLDHTGHSEKERARGASGKGANTKLALSIVKTVDFDRETVGEIRVDVKKNTLAADVPPTQVYRIGGSEEGFVFERDALAAFEDGSAERPETWARIVTDVARAIEDAGEDGITPTALRSAVNARPEAITRACISLWEHGLAERLPGRKAGSFRYRTVPGGLHPSPELLGTVPGTVGNGSRDGSLETPGAGHDGTTRKRVKPFTVPPDSKD